MAYRRLGRTGLLVSEISLGSSPLPDPDLLRAIVDRGVNYIDTSHNYENGNAERRIGRLLKDVGRDKLLVATKFHVAPRDTPETIAASVHGSLRRLDVATIDVLMIHGAESAGVLDDGRVLEAYDRLKREGAFRFRGLSCHANQDEVVRKAVSCGLYDMVQVGYNVFDIQEPDREVETYPDYLAASGIGALIGLAHSRDVGVIAMKTLKVGGRRQDLGKYRTGLGLRLPGHAEVGPRRHAGDVGPDRDPQPRADGGGPGSGRGEAGRGGEVHARPLRPRERDRLLPRLCPMRPGLPVRRGHGDDPPRPRLCGKLREGRSGPERLRFARERRDGSGLPRLRGLRKGLPLRRGRAPPDQGSRAAPGLITPASPLRSARRSRSSGRRSGRSGRGRSGPARASCRRRPPSSCPNSPGRAPSAD
ncbi:MAG: aldo/keto reductase [Ignavibacteriales bacterium]|nr:aldo/keto reductase [Ignavibacteriales bacterium]